MYDTLSDILKIAGVVLTVLLPMIAAFYAYKREEKKPPIARTVGQAGLLAIGGALASEHDTFAYVDATNRHTKSLDLQTEAMTVLAGALKGLERTNIATCEEIGKIERVMGVAVEEVKKIRIEIEEINRLTRRTLPS